MINCPECRLNLDDNATECPACGFQLIKPEHEAGHRGADIKNIVIIVIFVVVKVVVALALLVALGVVLLLTVGPSLLSFIDWCFEIIFHPGS
jgi:hypothetical protein